MLSTLRIPRSQNGTAFHLSRLWFVVRATFSAAGGQAGGGNAVQNGQRGLVAIFVVLCLMVLAVGAVPAALSLSSTLSRDSEVKSGMVKRQYAAISGQQYAKSAITQPVLLASMVPGASNTQLLTVRGNSVNVTITELDPIGMDVEGVSSQADVVMTLDVSGSVSSSELVLLKDAAIQVVDALDILENAGEVRMGVRRFRGSSASVVAMTDVDQPAAAPPVVPLRAGINGLVQGGPGLTSGTNLVVGLTGANAQFATGLGDRPTVPNLIIMITDGDDTAGNSNATIAAASLATGAEVFAVGVGDEIQTASLNAIATDGIPTDPGYNPADPNAGHRFYASDFSGLLSIIDGLTTAVIESMQIRVFRIESSVDGYLVESVVTVGFDGTVTEQSWTIR